MANWGSNDKNNFRIAQVRDFSGQSYLNPIFPSKRRPSRVWIVVIFLILIVFGGAALLLFSPWLNINRLEIHGLKNVSESEMTTFINDALDTQTLKLFRNRHRWFFNAAKLGAELEKRFGLEWVKIERKSDTLIIVLKEKPTGVLLTDGVRFVFADLNGLLTRDATASEINVAKEKGLEAPFFILNVETAFTEQAGTEVLTEKFLSNLESLKLRFETETGLGLDHFSIQRLKSDWVKAVLSDKREVYFDLNRDTELQIQKLLALIKDKKKEVEQASYIDLRFEDRIYFK
ncbi:MAG: hypothetical protein V1821_01500 [bacterium]